MKNNLKVILVRLLEDPRHLSALGGFIRLGVIYPHVTHVAKNRIISSLDNLNIENSENEDKNE